MLTSAPVLLIAFLLSDSSAGLNARREYALPSGVVISIVEAPFSRPKFRITGCVREGEACRINGRIPFGRTSQVPKTYIARIAISFAGATHLLDSSDMYDAWGGRPLEYPGKIRYLGGQCYDANNCQIRGLFSDGAGTFVAEWRVIHGRPIRTVLTDSSDVVDLFVRHIDPPKFE